jgi:hypothetical protein
MYRKDSQSPWNIRLGGPQIWYEDFGEKKNLLQPGLEP